MLIGFEPQYMSYYRKLFKVCWEVKFSYYLGSGSSYQERKSGWERAGL